jgi:hypothetical protein
MSAPRAVTAAGKAGPRPGRRWDVGVVGVVGVVAVGDGAGAAGGIVLGGVCAVMGLASREISVR